jgi:hypothetical protein
MPDALALQDLPPELQAALNRAWPGNAEAQLRALLGPRCWLGWRSVWPGELWAWRPASRWLRPGQARANRQRAEAFFAAHVADVRQPLAARLFDPAQPFFETPWTHATVLLRSPVPEVFSDADYWAMTQQLFGGDAEAAAREAQAWARAMQADGAARPGPRRQQWLGEALWRLQQSATGTYA